MQIVISKQQIANGRRQTTNSHTQGGIRLEDYELADKLRSMYENARRNEAVCQINLFGIIYATEIQTGGHKLKHIVELSGISKGYLTEISKGMKLSKYVALRGE